MTDTPTITQADRALAADFYDACGLHLTGSSIREGGGDQDEYVIRIARHRAQEPLGAADVGREMRGAMTGARMRLEVRAQAATDCLAKTDWRPTRAHIEGMRNAMRDAIVEINEAIGVLSAPPAGDGTPSAALTDIGAERRRQIEAEGYDPAHDDEHDRDLALPRAAACYALAGTGGNGPFWINPGLVPQQVWPYRWEWKPYDRRRNLVRAGALIVAEIERVDRAFSEDPI